MTALILPYRATTAEACAWLAEQLGDPWSLARLLEHGITPYVWLDYDPAYPDLFGDANGGYAAPIFFEGDTARLAQGSPDVLITRTKDVHKIVTTLPAPGFTRELDALRFMKKDLEKLSTAVKKAHEPAKPVVATESRDGLGQQEIMAVFAPLLRIDLAAALSAGGGVFGDEGARVKGSAARGKNKAIWNPVTLALGLNDAHRVPIGQLKRAFATHEVLQPWAAQWNQSLALLGK
jgi:hypothetical protein